MSDHEYPALTGRSGTQRGGQSGTRSGNSARPGLDQVVELLGHGIVPASGEEQVQPVGLGNTIRVVTVTRFSVAAQVGKAAT